MGEMSIANSVAEAIPPTVPAMVFEGDNLGMIFAPPISLPHTYCKTSLACTTPIIKISNKILLAEGKPSKFKNNKAGTWDKQKMQIIAIHCVLAVRSRK